MTKQTANFPCGMIMIHNEFDSVSVLIHKKTFSPADGTSMMLLFKQTFILRKSNSVRATQITFGIRSIHAILGTIKMRRSLWNKQVAAYTTIFFLEITLGIL